MYLIPIAWIYVTLMMAVAEATNTNGTVLGAVVTFVLYGLLPVGLLLYFMGSGERRRVREAAQALEGRAEPTPASADSAAQATASAATPEPTASNPPDGSRLAPRDAVAPVGKVP